MGTTARRQPRHPQNREIRAASCSASTHGHAIVAAKPGPLKGFRQELLCNRPMSGMGQKAKFRADQRTSALAPKADIPRFMSTRPSKQNARRSGGLFLCAAAHPGAAHARHDHGAARTRILFQPGHAIAHIAGSGKGRAGQRIGCGAGSPRCDDDARPRPAGWVGLRQSGSRSGRWRNRLGCNRTACEQPQHRHRHRQSRPHRYGSPSLRGLSKSDTGFASNRPQKILNGA